MSELVTRWFGRLHRVSGVVAYGLRTHDAHTFSRTWDGHFSEAALNAFWPRLDEIARTAIPHGEAAELLRWGFHDHLVTAVTRADDTVFYILRTKDSRSVDEAGLDRLANEFRGLRA